MNDIKTSKALRNSSRLGVGATWKRWYPGVVTLRLCDSLQ